MKCQEAPMPIEVAGAKFPDVKNPESMHFCVCVWIIFYLVIFVYDKNMERFTNLSVILAQGPC